MSTTLYMFKNAKGEIIQTVRAQSAQDAQYIAGINGTALVNGAAEAKIGTSTVEAETITLDSAGHRK